MEEEKSDYSKFKVQNKDWSVFLFPNEEILALLGFFWCLLALVKIEFENNW